MCMVFVYTCFPVEVYIYKYVHMYGACVCMFFCAGVQVQLCAHAVGSQRFSIVLHLVYFFFDRASHCLQNSFILRDWLPSKPWAPSVSLISAGIIGTRHYPHFCFLWGLGI